MLVVKKLNKWANTHYSFPMNALRMFLGIFLFVKGLEFATGTEELVQLIRPDNPDTATLFLAHYVAMAHLAGGILVFFGLITRLALLIQLPIFFGAVIIHLIQGAEAFVLGQALVALVGSLAFVVYGSGRYSVDYRMKLEV